MKLEQLKDCHLCKARRPLPPTPGYGPKKANICLLGRNPGYWEEKTQKPFAGPAGDVLDTGLRIAQIARRKCWQTNVVKCSTPGKAPSRLTADICTTYWLSSELQELPALALIIALGNEALWYFEPEAVISVVHGEPFETELNDGRTIWLFPTYSPSAVLRDRRVEYRFIQDMHKLAHFYQLLIQGAL